MEPIKNVLNQAGDFVQQVAHTVVDAIRGGENEEEKKDNVCFVWFNKNRCFLLFDFIG